ncbi:MAG: FKBP-type peptidyl-prolyl cis-trans isomerase [Bacteroidetes bacterium]|nr:FKBP-type peptidyl-prolyl cis-trans isomerase [Bacteroidota bacterium]MCL2303166.1 FKBP-type peptidyl-prolyl cis-trans isomerase [Lentimicrobiaceae bacterium]
MKNVTKLMIALVVLVALGTACSKYPGFKKDKKEGFYYKFYTKNKNEIQPQIGDIVEFTYSFRTKDSVLVENVFWDDMIRESVYRGDIYAALQKMHLGDSATFILNADTFFHYSAGQPFPFGGNDLYLDVRLHSIVSQEEFERRYLEQLQQEEAMMEEFRFLEDDLINEYIEKHNIKVKPTANGLYVMRNVTGTGKQIKDGSRVAIHYTGKFLDGNVFDSSLEYGMPIELTVGVDRFIQGWEEALLLLRGGDKVTVLIPSNLAYGARGIKDPRDPRGVDYVIPPYSPLIFDMEVVSVE